MVLKFFLDVRVFSKRGLSAVIVTLLLVLLSIVLIGIVWVVISNLVSSNSQQVSLASKCLGSGLKITSFQCTSSGNECNVTVKRTSGNDEIGGVRILFSNDNDDSNFSDSQGNLITLSSKKVVVGYLGVTNITHISAAIYFNYSGKIYPCSITSSELVGSVSSGGTSAGGLSPPPLPDY